MKKLQPFFIMVLVILLTKANAQSIVINEIMSSNNSTISDEDGDYSDWLEIYNNSGSTINLDKYALTDDESDLTKWKFPSIDLASHQHLLVFASDKNRKEFNNTIIKKGDTWKYKIWTQQPPYTWNTVSYNDDNWSSGATGIGFGDDDDATIVPTNTISVYTRKTFTVEDKDAISSAILSMDYDDGFVAYINGVEVARANVYGEPPSYNQTANPDHEAQMYQGLAPENFSIANLDNILVNGTNVLAVSVHNTSQFSSDFSFIPYLTLRTNEMIENAYTPPELPLNPAGLHTNFKISSSGETLVLTSSDGSILDKVVAGEIPTDISYGRYPDGSDTWNFFNSPTPGAENNSAGFTTYSPEVIFDKVAGYYSGSITVKMSLESGDFPIYYTTDGSVPTASSNKYSSALTINSTTILRAKSIAPNSLPGKITSASYFFNTNHELPVISLITAPDNFFDVDSGIYVLGRNYEHETPNFGANFWEDWEKPIHIELFEPNGDLGFSVNAGVKIFGGWSRAQPEKSLAFFLRSKYGDKQIDYKIFPDRDIEVFDNFVLRNSANDFGFTMLRDGFLQSLIAGSHIDDQAYRPSVVYINGEYWGIHNIREKLNENYVATHHNVDPNNVDLLESHGVANNGDADDYWHIYNFIAGNSMRNEDNWEYVKSKIDLNNFMDYFIAEIFFDNTDWPGNNIKYWKEKSEAGKWRWILYDTDFGFALFNGIDRYKFNTLEFATEPNGPDWPNPPWSTLLLRKFLTNDEFKTDFINCFCDNLNKRFAPRILSDKLDVAKARIESEIQNHINRWGAIPSKGYWESEVEKIREFGNKRHAFSFLNLNSFFGLNGTTTVTLEIDPPASGNIQLNTIILEDTPFIGSYFKGLPITVKAMPNPGYKFTEWTGDLESSEINPGQIMIDGNTKITCYFEMGTPDDEDIMITEINYKSADDFDTGDWVEIYNNSEFPMPMTGWTFKDSDDDHGFVIPEDYILEPKSYVVLVENNNDFHDLQPAITNVLGDLDFGLSKDGENLRLYNPDGELIDAVNFTSKSPWPTEPNGDGSTLALKNPESNNSKAENWIASDGHGTPGKENFPTSIDDENIDIPTAFALAQNYPNPFNNSTTINFSIPQTGKVKISVYDLRGKMVDTILNSNYTADRYSVHYNINENLSSGLYFYALELDGKLIKVNKMMYLK